MKQNLDSETYKALFRLARDAIIIEMNDQTIIDANPAAEVLLGYSLEELFRMKTYDLLSQDRQKDTPHQIYTDPESEDNLTFQTEILTNDGHTFPAEITITPLQTDEGWLFLSIIRDISVFRDAEQALKEAQTNLEMEVQERTKALTTANEEILQREQRYKNLVQGSLQGIAILEGPPFKFTFLNEAGSRIIGYPIDVLTSYTSDDVEELVHWTDRSRILRYIGDILAGKRESVRTEARFTKESDEVIWLDLSMTGVRIQDDLSLIATFIDITEQRQALADLMDTQRDLALFGGLLRHDLRNDLQVITGNSEVMRLSAPENEMVQQFAEANITGVKRMLELLNIFGRPEIERKRMISPTLESLSVEATKTHVGMICQLHIDPDIVMTRVVGGRMLPMVFRNLINNSAKHAGEKPRVEIRVSRSGNFVEVRVSDNGPGIPTEIRENLFQKGVSTTGGGLGLYLSKKVVEAYGGSIDLVDPENDREGAVFLVKLAITVGGREEILTN